MTIFVPRHVNERPVYFCTLCSSSFYVDERRQYEHHVIRGHSVEDLREHSLHAKAPGIFDPNHESGDVEWGRWIDRMNKERPGEEHKWMRTGDGKS